MAPPLPPHAWGQAAAGVGSGGQTPPLPPGVRRKSWQVLPAPAPVDRRVFVGGLSRQTDEAALHGFFAQWGHVADVKIIYDSKRISKGCVRGWGVYRIGN